MKMPSALVSVGHNLAEEGLSKFNEIIKPVIEERGYAVTREAKVRNVRHRRFFRDIYGKIIEGSEFNPDILISFFLPFTAHVGRFLKKPVIGFTDTEHATLSIFLAEKFTDTIVTPKSYKRIFSEKKHLRFNGNFELASLHPNYFKPDHSVLEYLGVKRNEKFIIMRFVSWAAVHDIGHKGLSSAIKRRAVKELSKYAKVFITSEAQLPDDLKKYQIKIPPEKLHDALYYAALYFGDGATTASEAAILGTPSVYVSTLAKSCGVLEEFHNKYDLIYIFDEGDQGLKKAIDLIKMSSSKIWVSKREKILKEKIDVTAFMVWLIENYPESAKIMKKNPDYQWNFR